MQPPAVLESRDTRYAEAQPLPLPSSDTSHQSSTTSLSRKRGMQQSINNRLSCCHWCLQLRARVIYKRWRTVCEYWFLRPGWWIEIFRDALTSAERADQWETIITAPRVLASGACSAAHRCKHNLELLISRSKPFHLTGFSWNALIFFLFHF